MSIVSLLSTYVKISSYKFATDENDDQMDKLSRKFSAIVMIVFSALLSIYQLVGQPIECWCPNELAHRCAYAKTYCYITGTYIPIGNGTGLPSRKDLQSHQILYYQWVPYIFMLQAFLFYLPHIIWRMTSRGCGFDLKNYVKVLQSDTSGSTTSNSIKYVASHIKTCLDFQKNYQARQSRGCSISVRRMLNTNGIYLTSCHFGVKLLYTGTALFQLIMLNLWMRDSHHSNLSLGEVLFGAHNFRLEERFPRMTLCKFSVYILTDEQTHWVQCTLPINFYIEKIYMLVWSWLWVLLILNVIGLAWTLFKIFSKRASFIRARTNHFLQEHEQIELVKCLKMDGFTMLTLLKSNTNEFYLNAVLYNLSTFKFDKHD